MSKLTSKTKYAHTTGKNDEIFEVRSVTKKWFAQYFRMYFQKHTSTLSIRKVVELVHWLIFTPRQIEPSLPLRTTFYITKLHIATYRGCTNLSEPKILRISRYISCECGEGLPMNIESFHVSSLMSILGYPSDLRHIIIFRRIIGFLYVAKYCNLYRSMKGHTFWLQELTLPESHHD